jgi:hypothetical protein
MNSLLRWRCPMNCLDDRTITKPSLSDAISFTIPTLRERYGLSANDSFPQSHRHPSSGCFANKVSHPLQ